MKDELFDDLVAVAKQAEPETAPVVFEGQENRMIAMAIQNGNIDMLERLLKARAAEEERQARIAFEEAFSRMRAELPGIAKKKDNGATKSKYAPIEDIQRACDPVIYKHSFSYAWREEALVGAEGKRVIMDIFGYGYTKSNCFDCPKISGNNAQNAIQVAGAMSTYGRRYTFVSGFGVIVEGEDSDGQISTDTEVLRMQLQGFLEERDASGKFKLTAEAHDVIKKELAKAEPDLARLQKFYQLAKAKSGAVK